MIVWFGIFVSSLMETPIASVLFSGVTAVIVSQWMIRYSENRALRREVLQRVLGNRFRLTPILQQEKQRGEPYIALNEIAVVFSKYNDVIEAVNKYHSCMNNKMLLELIRKMAKRAGVSTKKLDDNFLKRPFTPPK